MTAAAPPAPTLDPACLDWKALRCSSCYGRIEIGRTGTDCFFCGGFGVRRPEREVLLALSGVLTFSVPSGSRRERSYTVHYFAGRAVCDCESGLINGRCYHAQEITNAMSSALATRPNEAALAKTKPAEIRLAPPSRSLPLREELSLMHAIAKTVVGARGHALPAAIDSPEKAFAIMLAGWEYGVMPMTALRMIFVVNGRTDIMGQLMAAIVRSRDPRVQFEIPEYTQEAVTVTLKRPGQQDVTCRYTKEDAVKSGQYKEKRDKGPTPWELYTRDMLYAAAIKRCCRIGAPDLINAISPTVGEAHDMLVDVRGEEDVYDATAPAAAIPAAAYNEGDEPEEEETPEAREERLRKAGGRAHVAWMQAHNLDPKDTPLSLHLCAWAVAGPGKAAPWTNRKHITGAEWETINTELGNLQPAGLRTLIEEYENLNAFDEDDEPGEDDVSDGTLGLGVSADGPDTVGAIAN